MSDPTGSGLQQAVADLHPRVDISVTAQKDRLMRHGDIVLRQIMAEIVAISPHYRLDSVNFSTAANRVPNEYTITSGGDINITNFMGGIQHLYRIITDATGDYVELFPFDQIRQQHEMVDPVSHDGSSSSLGPPTNYLLTVDSLWLFPISDAVYTLRMWYSRAPAPIVTGDVVDVPESFYNALVYGVAREESLYRKEKEANEFNTLYQSAMASAVATLIHRDEAPQGINYRERRSAYV